jgi:hypothetical protein
MSICAIPFAEGKIRRGFEKDSSYWNAAKEFLSSNDEGYFYNPKTAAKAIERRKGITPFLPSKFEAAVGSVHHNTATLTHNEYFSKDLSDLFEGSVDAQPYMLNGFEQKLIKSTSIDLDNETLTIDNSDLNARIQGYKNDLFRLVFDYVEKYKDIKSEFIPLYDGKRFIEDSKFNTVLNELAEIFKNKEYSPKNKSIYKASEVAVLDVFNAGIILSNFDTLIEDRFNNILSVNQTNFGKLNNPLHAFHYFLEFQGMKTVYWNKSEEHSQEGVEQYASSFIKVIASTIPLLDIDGKPIPNQYLGLNGISLIAGLIKDHNNKTPGDIDYQQNPKKYLSKFLVQLRKSGDITYESKVNSLFQYLKKVKNITEDKLTENPSLVADIMDIEAVIAHQINNSVAPTYSIHTVSNDPKIDKKKLIALVGRDFQGGDVKKQLLDTVLQNKNLYSNLKVKGDIVTTSKGNVINNINKPDTGEIKLLTNLTGINITPTFLKLLNKTNNAKAYGDGFLGAAFADLLRIGKDIINLEGKKIHKDELLKKFDESTRVVDLITVSIANISPEANMTFNSTEGNSIPTIKLSNIAHEKKTVIDLAHKHFKGLPSLFLQNAGLYKSTETTLEVEKDGKATPTLELNPAESFVTSFIQDYLKPMQMTESEVEKNGNYISFKLVNYSDKSTILQEMIDQNKDIDGLGSLKTMPLKTLKGVHMKYLNTFYANVLDKVILNYSKLVTKKGGKQVKVFSNLEKGDRLKSLDKIDKFLVSDGKNFKKIVENTWQHLNELGVENVTFTDEVMYSKYKDGLRINKTISEYHKRTLPHVSKEESIIGISEQLFVNKLLEVTPKIPNTSALFEKKGQSYVTDLYKNLGLKLRDWVTFSNRQATNFTYFKYKNSDGKTISVTALDQGLKAEDLNNVEINPLLAKWLHTQNLIRYNSLALSTKHEYQHPHKTGKSYDDLDFISEMSGRSISMTKRMVIHPATMEYYQQGLVDGIPPKIKLAVMDDMTAISYNFSGDKEFHDAWDGSLAANPFLSYLLKKSFPAKGISDVQKAIGTSSTDTHSTFLKCALFTFNNELIRKSMGSTVNLDNVMKSMNNIDISDIDVSRNSLNNDLIELDQLVPEGIYYKQKGTTYRVDSYEKLEKNKYIFTLEDKVGKVSTVMHEINNLYDLWQTFGGAYSKSEIGGNLVYSDASTNVVGAIISLVSNGDLKDRMIGILAQKSSVKNGASNINSSEIMKEKSPKLMYTDFDTNFFGIQLDANHVSDRSVVNEISQVISALAENQSTPELYSELYAAIGEIIDSEIKKYNKEFRTEIGEFNKEKLSNDFIKVLKKSDQQGNSLEIVKLLEDLSADTIPISNHNFFGGFVINVISRLKTDFIKRKYPGISAVLNPSHGMLQMFEDEEGNAYFYDDLLELVEERHFEDVGGDLHTQNTQAIQRVIDEMFPTEVLSPENYGKIKPLDHIRITNPNAEKEEDRVRNYNLQDIEDYYFIKEYIKNAEGLTVEIIKNKPRDLKPIETSFKQAGITRNIFDNDPIRLTWAYTALLDGKVVSDEDVATLQNFADFFANKEGFNTFNIRDKEQKDFVNKKLNLWNKRSFELLATKNNFLQVDSETNFSLLFGNDDFVSSLPEVYTGIIEPITDYVHKPAEIIMPKVYRSEFDIGTDSFSKINSQKEQYFVSKLASITEPVVRDVDLFVSSNKGDHSYISILNDEEIEAKGLTRKHIITKSIEGNTWRVDMKGTKIYKLKGISIYEKDGVEHIVVRKNGKEARNISNLLKQLDTYFVYAFAANDPENLVEYQNIANRKNPNIISQLEGSFDDIKGEVVNQLAISMYTSWKKSNDVLVARIPSQAMQSFMSMKTIGYTEDPGNNVYVSHWQIWLQGSDFDIDKAYIMMHGFKKGIYNG